MDDWVLRENAKGGCAIFVNDAENVSSDVEGQVPIEKQGFSGGSGNSEFPLPYGEAPHVRLQH